VAISVLDVRDSFGVAPVQAPLSLVPAPAEAGRRRLPLPVVVASLAALLESVALLAAGLTGLHGVLPSPGRPAGVVLALGLGLLATWIVLSAGGGAALLDASGNRLFRGVCYAEFALVGALLTAALTTGLFHALPVPAPALALLLLAVPTGKLLLAGTPAAVAWVAQGPRPRAARPDPVARHRVLCIATLAAIGLALGTVALVAPAGTAQGTTASSAVAGH
jgi:hypothetical protein